MLIDRAIFIKRRMTDSSSPPAALGAHPHNSGPLVEFLSSLFQNLRDLWRSIPLGCLKGSLGAFGKTLSRHAYRTRDIRSTATAAKEISMIFHKLILRFKGNNVRFRYSTVSGLDSSVLFSTSLYEISNESLPGLRQFGPRFLEYDARCLRAAECTSLLMRLRLEWMYP